MCIDTHRCRHIVTPDKSKAVCNQTYQRRGCRFDCFSQLSRRALTQFSFVLWLQKNLVCKQALQSSQINTVVFSSSGKSHLIECEGTTTLRWKELQRIAKNPGFHVFDAWCLLAGLWSVTYLHVCLPGRWVCWRCPCAGKNTPLWPPRSHWLSANQRQSALPRQQVVPHTEHPHTHIHTHARTHTDERPIDEASS